MKVGIIGAGIGGIATAVRLAARGHTVEVFEANAQAGGKLSQFDLGDFRFDAGPSLFTMPQYVEELFAVAGENAADYFTYERIPIVCHYFWNDKQTLLAHADPSDFSDEAATVLGVPAQVVADFLKRSRLKYHLTGRIFLEHSLHRAATWLNCRVVRALFHLPKFDIFSSMHRTNKRALKHPRLVQLFDRFATYNGSNPYRASGMLTVIPHFEHGIGAFYPHGGMYAITQSLVKLAIRLGVKFHFNTPVQEIIVADGRAAALRTPEATLPFDRIVSNMDVFFTYSKLLPNALHPKRILAQEKSTSAIIFYWGIRQKFGQLGLHNIFFADDYRAEFDYLQQGELWHDPTIYINITSKLTSTDAPPDAENWFVMVNAPYIAGQDWDKLVAETRERTLQKLSNILDVNLRDLVVCEDTLDPRTIQSRTQSHLGALYGTSSNHPMSAFLRHPNQSNYLRDLYFCGGSVHPGGGIPLALLSAKIVDDLMHTS